MRRLLWLVIAAGCAADSGALGNTTVSPECAPTDFACVTAGLDGPLAVGGVLPLSIDVDALGTSSGAMTLMSGDPRVIKAAGTEIVGLQAGVAALVMLSESSAVDFLHVYVAAPTRVGLQRIEDGLVRQEVTDQIELLVGDELVVEVAPYKDTQRLLGHATTTWTAGAPLALLKDGVPARRRIVARTPGETEVTVTSFGFTKTLRVAVLP
ncbi:MAG: hypothetical protein JNL83_03230 [Myxococcales bacterium]|nr:hypothetical protein [Myxococcales bacterium]